MRFFTYYWNSEQYSHVQQTWEAGQVDWCDYTGGSGFRQRGIEHGDMLYILNWGEGCLSILGRMTVDRILDQAEAVARLGSVYDAPEHVVALDRSCTPLVLDAVLEDQSEIGDLEFVNADGSTSPPKRGASGVLEPQTFRNVREVTPATAELFDLALGFDRDHQTDSTGSLRRWRTIEFTVRDDRGELLELAIDVPATGAALNDRDVALDVSVAGAIDSLDSSGLARLLWDRAQAEARAHQLKLDVGPAEFEEVVTRSLMSPPSVPSLEEKQRVLQITLGRWIEEPSAELDRPGRGYRKDLTARELVTYNRGQWRTKIERAAEVTHILFVHDQRVVAAAEVRGEPYQFSADRIAWPALEPLPHDHRVGEPADRSYGNPLRYLF